MRKGAHENSSSSLLFHAQALFPKQSRINANIKKTGLGSDLCK